MTQLKKLGTSRQFYGRLPVGPERTTNDVDHPPSLPGEFLCTFPGIVPASEQRTGYWTGRGRLYAVTTV